MIHYSPLPAELIFQDPYALSSVHQEIVVDGVQMLVHIDQTGSAKIVRLLSGNPQHYLDPRFQPGNSIQWIPKI
ncbi:YlzJ-like family protein [Thermoflavimicrobium dichotomicum]|uniref:YlzJ-like protein n=1 Tax=Thermoflavimicrobium dichotomicum TaxID=46223 RepID=A0A1I3PS00_9BACL|nr:YlzJ-like family protein [Thermoflavimicrobium dichotomicum]SFJ24279.1 YlzJ-like protein [Thermoflavimicrobium dichotomicum]